MIKATKHLWKNLRTHSFTKNTVIYKSAPTNELWKGSYKQYLKSKQWRRIKYGYFLWLRHQNPGERLRCANCGKKMTKGNRQHFHVHHKTYERLGCERHSDLALLCKPCHKKEHDKEKE